MVATFHSWVLLSKRGAGGQRAPARAAAGEGAAARARRRGPAQRRVGCRGNRGGDLHGKARRGLPCGTGRGAGGLAGHCRGRRWARGPQRGCGSDGPAVRRPGRDVGGAAGVGDLPAPRGRQRARVTRPGQAAGRARVAGALCLNGRRCCGPGPGGRHDPRGWVRGAVVRRVRIEDIGRVPPGQWEAVYRTGPDRTGPARGGGSVAPTADELREADAAGEGRGEPGGLAAVHALPPDLGGSGRRRGVGYCAPGSTATPAGPSTKKSAI